MKRSHGLRVGTRSILRRRRSERSRINISRTMHEYAEGDRVAIVLDGGEQRSRVRRLWLLQPAKVRFCEFR